MLHIFDWLIFRYFLQLILRLTPLTSAAKSNEKLKSVHFKNTVTRSSFHSKLWPFSIIHQLKSKQSQLNYYWKRSYFEWNEDLVTVFLKWTDFKSLGILLLCPIYFVNYRFFENKMQTILLLIFHTDTHCHIVNFAFMYHFM